MTMIPQNRASRANVGLSAYMPSADAMMRAARQRPEALLVIAAGLALLMRGASRPRDWRMMSESKLRARGLHHNVRDDAMAGWASSGEQGASVSEAARDVGERARDTGERMTSYAAQMSGRMSEAASDYASAAGRWAEETRDEFSERTQRLMEQARALPGELDEAVRDHPLVLAALGVAVGAALGASFPASSLENRAMGGARDQLGEAAQGVAGRLTDAAERALAEAKRSAERQGVSGESVRDMARDAAGAFASAAMGREEGSGGAGGGSSRS
jgi:ElaB/YqjD/DUF883 family membrane-anchored ribosome-binding protein